MIITFKCFPQLANTCKVNNTAVWGVQHITKCGRLVANFCNFHLLKVVGQIPYHVCTVCWQHHSWCSPAWCPDESRGVLMIALQRVMKALHHPTDHAWLEFWLIQIYLKTKSSVCVKTYFTMLQIHVSDAHGLQSGPLTSCFCLVILTVCMWVNLVWPSVYYHNIKDMR